MAEFMERLLTSNLFKEEFVAEAEVFSNEDDVISLSTSLPIVHNRENDKFIGVRFEDISIDINIGEDSRIAVLSEGREQVNNIILDEDEKENLREVIQGEVLEVGYRMQSPRITRISGKGEFVFQYSGSDGRPSLKLEGLTVKEVERVLIFDAMEKSKGNEIEAGKIVGYGKSTIYRKLKEYAEDGYTEEVARLKALKNSIGGDRSPRQVDDIHPKPISEAPEDAPETIERDPYEGYDLSRNVSLEDFMGITGRKKSSLQGYFYRRGVGQDNITGELVAGYIDNMRGVVPEKKEEIRRKLIEFLEQPIEEPTQIDHTETIEDQTPIDDVSRNIKDRVIGLDIFNEVTGKSLSPSWLSRRKIKGSELTTEHLATYIPTMRGVSKDEKTEIEERFQKLCEELEVGAPEANDAIIPEHVLEESPKSTIDNHKTISYRQLSEVLDISLPSAYTYKKYGILDGDGNISSDRVATFILGRKRKTDEENQAALKRLRGISPEQALPEPPSEITDPYSNKYDLDATKISGDIFRYITGGEPDKREFTAREVLGVIPDLDDAESACTRFEQILRQEGIEKEVEPAPKEEPEKPKESERPQNPNYFSRDEIACAVGREWKDVEGTIRAWLDLEEEGVRKFAFEKAVVEKVWDKNPKRAQEILGNLGYSETEMRGLYDRHGPVEVYVDLSKDMGVKRFEGLIGNKDIARALIQKHKLKTGHKVDYAKLAQIVVDENEGKLNSQMRTSILNVLGLPKDIKQARKAVQAYIKKEEAEKSCAQKLRTKFSDANNGINFKPLESYKHDQLSRIKGLDEAAARKVSSQRAGSRNIPGFRIAEALLNYQDMDSLEKLGYTGDVGNIIRKIRKEKSQYDQKMRGNQNPPDGQIRRPAAATAPRTLTPVSSVTAEYKGSVANERKFQRINNVPEGHIVFDPFGTYSRSQLARLGKGIRENYLPALKKKTRSDSIPGWRIAEILIAEGDVRPLRALGYKGWFPDIIPQIEQAQKSYKAGRRAPADLIRS